jgi:hypothetical protein
MNTPGRSSSIPTITRVCSGARAGRPSCEETDPVPSDGSSDHGFVTGHCAVRR